MVENPRMLASIEVFLLPLLLQEEARVRPNSPEISRHSVLLLLTGSSNVESKCSFISRSVCLFSQDLVLCPRWCPVLKS
jgi:hypothetical protein